MVVSAAAAISKSGTELISGKPENTLQMNLYSRIYDKTVQNKLKEIEICAAEIIAGDRIFKPEDIKIRARIKNYIIYRKIELLAAVSLSLPLKGICRFFGTEGTYVIRAYSSSYIEDTAEMIRNTDFAYDVLDILKEKYPQVKNITGNLEEIMSKIKEGIDCFKN